MELELHCLSKLDRFRDYLKFTPNPYDYSGMNGCLWSASDEIFGSKSSSSDLFNVNSGTDIIRLGRVEILQNNDKAKWDGMKRDLNEVEQILSAKNRVFGDIKWPISRLDIKTDTIIKLSKLEKTPLDLEECILDISSKNEWSMLPPIEVTKDFLIGMAIYPNIRYRVKVSALDGSILTLICQQSSADCGIISESTRLICPVDDDFKYPENSKLYEFSHLQKYMNQIQDLQSPKNLNYIPFAMIKGPLGCGRSTLIEHYAKSNGYEILKWSIHRFLNLSNESGRNFFHVFKAFCDNRITRRTMIILEGLEDHLGFLGGSAIDVRNDIDDTLIDTTFEIFRTLLWLKHEFSLNYTDPKPLVLAKIESPIRYLRLETDELSEFFQKTQLDKQNLIDSLFDLNIDMPPLDKSGKFNVLFGQLLKYLDNSDTSYDRHQFRADHSDAIEKIAQSLESYELIASDLSLICSKFVINCNQYALEHEIPFYDSLGKNLNVAVFLNIVTQIRSENGFSSDRNSEFLGYNRGTSIGRILYPKPAEGISVKLADWIYRNTFPRDIKLIFQSKLHKDLNQVLPSGLLLYGPPGSAKTSVAKYLASHILQVPAYSVSITDLVKPGVGDSERALAQVFNWCKKRSSPEASSSSNYTCCLLIDEIDALFGGDRESDDLESTNQTSKRLIASFLGELDDLQDYAQHKSRVLLIATTNMPWKLDPSLFRCDRLEESIYLGTIKQMVNSSKQQNLEVSYLAEYILENKPIRDSKEIQDWIVEMVYNNSFVNWTISHILGLVQEAALLCLDKYHETRNKDQLAISKIDFILALKQSKIRIKQELIDKYNGS